VALGIILNFLIRRRFVLNKFPSQVSTAKLIDDFYNNRRSAANMCPRFAYTIGPAIRTKRSENLKNPRKLLIGTANLPRFAYRRASVPRFAYESRMPRSGNNFSCGSYIAPINSLIANPLIVYFCQSANR
jgi:hypothetical protein